MKWVNVIQIEGVFSPWLGSGKKVLLATVSFFSSFTIQLLQQNSEI